MPLASRPEPPGQPTPLRPGARPAVPAARWLRVRFALHRRPLAACCAALAVWSTLQVLRPPEPAGVDVLVAAADLAPGRVVRAVDLRRVRLPAATAPDGLEPDPVGRTLAGAMRAGEAFTDARVLSPAAHRMLGTRAGVPVRIADPAVVELLRVGDQVDVIAVDTTGAGHRVVARRAVVAGLPAERGSNAGSSSGARTGALVVLGVSPGEAAEVAAASARDSLQVLFPEAG